MHLEVLGKKIAQRVILLLHQKVGSVCHAWSGQ